MLVGVIGNNKENIIKIKNKLIKDKTIYNDDLKTLIDTNKIYLGFIYSYKSFSYLNYFVYIFLTFSFNKI